MLGAAAGVAAGSLLNHWEEAGKTGAFRSGYDKGRSDELKRLYWIQKRMHEGDCAVGASGNSTTQRIPQLSKTENEILTDQPFTHSTIHPFDELKSH